jgi:cytochrome c peroxidase
MEPVVATYPGITAELTVDPFNLPNYASVLPAYYDGAVAQIDNTPRSNPITNAGATLGRVLFYDEQLSINNTVSCASCHDQSIGFSDARRASPGFAAGLETGAHSMRLANARYYGGTNFFWDRRAATLEAQTSQPIQSPVEMGFDAAKGGLDSLFRKMRGLPYYTELHRLAFGDTTFSEARIQLAIAQFVRAMVSTTSRWDSGYAANYNPNLPDRGLNAPIASFTPQEERGRVLFMRPPPQGGAGCAGCHVPPTFSLATNSRSNGLDAAETTIFKSPSLKSVAMAGPYMHDGRLATLADVVDHYDSGIKDGPALDNRLRTPGGAPLVLNLSAADRAALVAFLGTLSDTQLSVDNRFTDPFKP